MGAFCRSEMPFANLVITLRGWGALDWRACSGQLTGLTEIDGREIVNDETQTQQPRNPVSSGREK